MNTWRPLTEVGVLIYNAYKKMTSPFKNARGRAGR